MDWHAALVGLCMGIGLAAAAGFRIFVPLLISGLVLRFEVLDSASSLAPAGSWLATDAALACFAIATGLEVLAYKVPWLDNILDALAAPAALAAGALLATQFLTPIENPLLRYGLGIIAGAGSSGIVYGTTAATRLMSTKTTGGIANPFLAIGELVASLLTTFVALLLPILAALAFAVMGCLGVVAWRKLRRPRKASSPESFQI